jgi:TonB family protein
MNRLEKKCLLATAGFHLLLLVILFVGPAFFSSKPKPDDSQVLDVIPANLVDTAVNSGVRGATPPPPTPVATPQPTPPAPAPIPTPTPLKPTPTPEKIDPPKVAVKPDLTPVEKQSVTKPQPPKVAPKIQVNLNPTVRIVPKNSPPTTATDDSQRQARAVKNVLQALRQNLASATTVDMPGNSSAAYANYASVVKSIYEQAWTPPDDAANDDANAKVRVTIASDGTVISARLLTPSGDSGVDATVQRTLNRVTFIAPFPEGTTDKERTYIINFNLKAKRMLG